MSGTSFDAVDVVLVEIAERARTTADEASSSCSLLSCRLVKSLSHEIPTELRERLAEMVCVEWRGTLLSVAQLDRDLGVLFADAVLALLDACDGVRRGDIVAIGSHGQTVAHHPDEAISLQLGDPNVVTARTGISVVGDLRRMDVALGGQGAPLVPAFHHALYGSAVTPDQSLVVLNIGGMANITVLHHDRYWGYDVGPGNVLLDLHVQRHVGECRYDADGAFARTGTVNTPLLARFLSDPFFAQEPPKSTGRERFNGTWLDERLNDFSDIAPCDVQATLAELTVRATADAVRHHTASTAAHTQVLVCGGGVHNSHIMDRLKALLSECIVRSTGPEVDPDWMEAMAFAWLAHCRVHGRAGNTLAGRTVTGARASAVLGGLYVATKTPL